MAQELILSEGFKSDYQALPPEIQQKIDKQLRFLSVNPAHPSLRLHPLHGTDGILDAAVDDRYRMTLEDWGTGYYLRRVGPHALIQQERRRTATGHPHKHR